jgi:hypothetical protein
MTNLEKYKQQVKIIKDLEENINFLFDKGRIEFFKENQQKLELKLQKFFSKVLIKDYSIQASFKCNSFTINYKSNLILGVNFLQGNKIIINSPRLNSNSFELHTQYIVIGNLVNILIKNESKYIKYFEDFHQKLKKDFNKKIETPLLKQLKVRDKHVSKLLKLINFKFLKLINSGKIDFENIYKKDIKNLNLSELNIILDEVKHIIILKKENTFKIFGKDKIGNNDTPFQYYTLKFSPNLFKEKINNPKFIRDIIYSIGWDKHENLFLDE